MNSNPVIEYDGSESEYIPIHHRHHHHHHLQSVLPKGRSFTANSSTKAAVLPKGKLRNQVAVLLRMNRCGSCPLLSSPHSLFSILIDLKRSEKIPGAPTCRSGEWIWLTRPFWLHRNSPKGLNINAVRVFDQIRDPEIPITLRPHISIMWTNQYTIQYSTTSIFRIFISLTVCV